MGLKIHKKLMPHGASHMFDALDVFNHVEYAIRCIEQGANDIATGEIEKATDGLKDLNDLIGYMIYENFGKQIRNFTGEVLGSVIPWRNNWYLPYVKGSSRPKLPSTWLDGSIGKKRKKE